MQTETLHTNSRNSKHSAAVNAATVCVATLNGTLAAAELIRKGTTMVKFYNGKKLVGSVVTNSPSRVINYWQTHTNVPEWTRYKIVS